MIRYDVSRQENGQTVYPGWCCLGVTAVCTKDWECCSSTCTGGVCAVAGSEGTCSRNSDCQSNSCEQYACSKQSPDAGALGPEDCRNSRDDNGDKKVDCADPQCATDCYCLGTC
ncbi:MAG: hypothetical protein QM765_21015 [Myxococcales bacterium]